VNKNMQVGNYAEFVDMADFPSGIYFYTLNASSFSETKKMILVK
jgi:hypothetical protein